MLNLYIKIIYKIVNIFIKLVFLLKCIFFFLKIFRMLLFQEKEEMRDLLCIERGVKDVNVIKK